MVTRRVARWVPLLAAAAVVLGGTAAGRACFMRSLQPVQVWLDHIHVDVVDGVAVKTYDCTFLNPNPQAVVGATCYMELEPGAQVDDMSVLVDGKEFKAEILDVEKAKQVFTDIVKNGGSPALLEYFGNQLIQTQVPKIAPNGTVTVKLKYTTVLPQRGGLYRLQMLNTNPKALMQPLKSAGVTVNIRSKDPLKNVYSPTHEVKLVEKEGWDVSVQWSQENYLPKHPFVLYFQTAAEQVGASLVAHRELDEPGTFMLMLSPTVGAGPGQVKAADILPKDVVFCADTSGSMLQGGKMEQARAALRYCLEQLRSGDRFNIVDFSTEARSFRPDGLVDLSDETRAAALKYVEKLSARGGTAIDEALSLSLKHLGGGSDRLKMVVFATDGLPTIGERDPEAILRRMAKENKQDVRVFVFGEGFDVNTKLLDFLALDHRGEADYILPDEKIEEKIARFFDRVGSPVFTDVRVEFPGLEVSDVHPVRVPDLFKGEQLVVYGRYLGHGRRNVRVSGLARGERKTFEFAVDFPEVSPDDKAAFVPRLWAGRKVDFLLGELRKSEKPEQELIDEVTRLAKQHGIVTPYTSFLVTDDVAGKNDPAQLNAALGGKLRALNAGPPAAPAEKAAQVTEAKQQNDYARAASRGGAYALDKAADEVLKAQGRNESSLAAIRSIGNRTFYNRNAQWGESAYDANVHKKINVVEVGSPEYFKLLEKDARLAQFLALGDVVLQVGKEWYQFKTQQRRG
jgi:Ca-activated chloride channel family protein